MDSACKGQGTLGVCAPVKRSVSRRYSPGAWRQRLAMLICLQAWICLPLAAAEPPTGTTSRQARDEAIRQIPFDNLNLEAKQKISYVVSNPSIFRRLPTKTIECDPEMYLFLVRYPEVVVGIWDQMGVTSVAMDRQGPYNFSADDGLGTMSDVELVYGDSHTHLLYANGAYDGQGPLLRNPVKGRCVMLLRSSFARSPTGQVLVTSQLDVFVRIESTGIDLLARTLHPLVGRTADINFMESTKFLGRLSAAAEANGAGVEELSKKLDKVHPEVRAKFAEVAHNVHQRAVLRLAERSIQITTAGQQPAGESVRMANSAASATLLKSTAAENGPAEDSTVP
jgi:hypothetical protein